MIVTFEEALAARETKGRTEGRVEGEVVFLVWQAEKKFGPLSEALKSRIRSADEATLRTWAERLLDAERLEDVFGVS